MIVAFEKLDRSFVAGVIRWWTHSPYSHCELIFPDREWFSSDPRDNGTRFKRPDNINYMDWDYLEIATTPGEDLIIQAWCVSELGCKYDWFGIFYSQFLHLQREDPHKWFCSEICTAALQRIGSLKDIKPCTQNPGSLFNLLKSRGANRIYYH
jgi:hypothetical protein